MRALPIFREKYLTLLTIFLILELSICSTREGVKDYLKSKLPSQRQDKTVLANKFNNCFIKFKLDGLMTFSTAFNEPKLFHERADAFVLRIESEADSDHVNPEICASKKASKNFLEKFGSKLFVDESCVEYVRQVYENVLAAKKIGSTIGSTKFRVQEVRN